MERFSAPQQPVYVFQLPIRLWHWVTVAAIAVLVPTGYIIGKPWHSLDGDPTFLFYMGYTRLVHFSAGFTLAVCLVWRALYMFIGNEISRQIFFPPVWRGAWWRDLVADIRWYLFLDRCPRIYMGHNPLAQLGMWSSVALIILMILTGFGMYVTSSDTSVLQPFRLVLDFAYLTGGNSLDLHSWHRLGMLLLMGFIVIHLYMVIREEIMGPTTLVSAMFSGYRLVRADAERCEEDRREEERASG